VRAILFAGAIANCLRWVCRLKRRLARFQGPQSELRLSGNGPWTYDEVWSSARDCCSRREATCNEARYPSQLVGQEAIRPGGLIVARSERSCPWVMEAPKDFEVIEGYCCFRLSGDGPLAEAAGKVIEAITFCREQGKDRLLIDTTNWTGHQSPDTLERYTWAQAFAEAARSTVKVAMVVRPEMVDPDKFEVTVARNRGLMGNVFDSEEDALAWLLKPAVDKR